VAAETGAVALGGFGARARERERAGAKGRKRGRRSGFEFFKLFHEIL
jgi:hypothetical protein